MPVPVARCTQFNNNGNIMGSPWAFHQYDQSGLPVSDLFPHVGKCADDLAVIRSMTAKFSEHAQGNFFMHTGLPFIGYPSVGAWVNYGLGSEARNLPGFVVLKSGGSTVPHGGVSLFSNGFLPAVHQASFIDADAAEPIFAISSPANRMLANDSGSTSSASWIGSSWPRSTTTRGLEPGHPCNYGNKPIVCRPPCRTWSI